jgi:glycosyltransferase involved in cell wall biosynthesis
VRVGVVVIGRNEGERLDRCLRSVLGRGCAVVYVDSGSSDGSPARAAALGARVVELDGSSPFTAARGRNAGVEALLSAEPELELVQVVDGDCEVQPGWLDAAAAFLDANPRVAVACGRRRERRPEASLWNLVTDVEWDAPPGESAACGGDAMLRVPAWRAAGGYDASLIAGEEPDLCWRLRRAGWRIVRLEREMTRHDAALLRFAQWWRRMRRSGHAYAELAWRQRGAPDPGPRRSLASILVWGAALPLICVLLAWPTGGWSAAGLALWAKPWWGAWRQTRRRWPARTAAVYASACLIGKLAEVQGVAGFVWNRALLRRQSRLIEYKRSEAGRR